MLAERVDETEQRGHPPGLSFLIRYSLTKLVRFLSFSVFEIIVQCLLLSNVQFVRLSPAYSLCVLDYSNSWTEIYILK